MKLFMDLGNSRIKWCFSDADALGAVQAVTWQSDMAAMLAGHWPSDGAPDAVWAASVAGSAREQAVEAAVRAAFGLGMTWVHTPAAACGVRNGYAQPGDLGVDRFLAMVAAFAHKRAPCVLVSCGTALVLDALAADGRHLGGMIAPGPELMRRSVLDTTAGVRPVARGRVTDAATSTADGLASGCWHACAALVDRFITRTGTRLGGLPGVLLGGGDAPALAPWLEHRGELWPHGVLAGLAVWAGKQR